MRKICQRLKKATTQVQKEDEGHWQTKRTALEEKRRVPPRSYDATRYKKETEREAKENQTKHRFISKSVQ